MEYAAFLQVLARDTRALSVLQPPGGVLDMAAYLTLLARRVLAGLGRDGDETTCRRLAAVSGLVRASPPEATIVLDRPDIAELAMARLDILVPRSVIVTAPDGKEGAEQWRVLETGTAAERLASLAERTGLFCPVPALNPGPGMTQPQTALALVTRAAPPDGLPGLRHILWLGQAADEAPWLQSV